jgi:hypothetical protein
VSSLGDSWKVVVCVPAFRDRFAFIAVAFTGDVFTTGSLRDEGIDRVTGDVFTAISSRGGEGIDHEGMISSGAFPSSVSVGLESLRPIATIFWCRFGLFVRLQRKNTSTIAMSTMPPIEPPTAPPTIAAVEVADLFEESSVFAVDGLGFAFPSVGCAYELKSGVSLGLALNPSLGTHLSAKEKHGAPMTI